MSDNVVKYFSKDTHNNNLLGQENLLKKNKHYSTESELEKNIEKFNRAKENLKQKIITSDNSNDKTAIYSAMVQFKKINE